MVWCARARLRLNQVAEYLDGRVCQLFVKLKGLFGALVVRGRGQAAGGEGLSN